MAQWDGLAPEGLCSVASMRVHINFGVTNCKIKQPQNRVSVAVVAVKLGKGASVLMLLQDANKLALAEHAPRPLRYAQGNQSAAKTELMSVCDAAACVGHGGQNVFAPLEDLKACKNGSMFIGGGGRSA